MDDIDRKILDYIQCEGRASYAEIGSAAGLSVSATNERLRKLQTQRVILGWGARVDPEKVGQDTLAFVFVALGQEAEEAPFVERILRHPEVLECHHITGEWNYLLKVRARNIKALEDILSKAVKAEKGIARTQTMVAFSSPKDSATIPCALARSIPEEPDE